MKKRGISPLIATVLIIGFTIVIGSLILIWGGDILEKIKGKTEEEAMTKLTCAQKVRINIKEACVFGNKLKLRVENIGERDITSLIFRVEGTKRAQLVDSRVGISTYSLTMFDEEFDVNTFSGVGEPKSVSVFPRILINNKEETCDSTKKDIISCYFLPKIIEDSKDWVFVEGDVKIALSNELEDFSLTFSTDYSLLLNALGSVNKAAVKSRSFTIVNVKDSPLYLHLRISKTQTETRPQIEVRNKENQIIKSFSVPKELVTSEIVVDITEEKGGEAYLYISIENGAIAVSEFCYTLGGDCIV